MAQRGPHSLSQFKESNPVKKPGRRTTCKAEGCFEVSAMNWRFCTKHRYFFEKFGSEIPPKTLPCACCKQEKDVNEFVMGSERKIALSALCAQCRLERDNKISRRVRKNRMLRLKINNPEKWREYRQKENRRKHERIKNNPIALEKKKRSHRTTCINRRARKAGNGGTHTQADIQFLFETQQGKCVCCRKSIKKKYHIDHIVPLAMGGGSEKANLQLLCPTCNTRKCALHPVEFMQRNGYLI
jgi:5-methylcytosine-specific restriction endonuclease McrA